MREHRYSEGCVLSDNIFPIGESRFYENYMYPLQTYRRVDRDLEHKLSGMIEVLENWWGSPEVRTVEPIVHEFSDLCELLRDKLAYLNYQANLMRKEWEHDPYKRYRHYNGKYTLENFCDNLFRIRKAMQKSVKRPGDETAFRKVLDSAYAVSRSTGCMYDYATRYNNPVKRSPVIEGVDEYLVSMAIYTSFVDLEPVILYTDDSDIYRTVHNTCHHLLQQGYSALHLQKNPVHVYMVDEEGLTLSFDSTSTERLLNYKYMPAYSFAAPRLCRVSDTSIPLQASPLAAESSEPSLLEGEC